MNILLNPEPHIVSNLDSKTETSSSTHLKQVKTISFRECVHKSERLKKVQGSYSGCSWNRLLSKIQKNPQASSETTVTQKDLNSHESREFLHHGNEAIVLALSNEEPIDFVEGDTAENKGYVITVSQNGISFASRSQFELRDELQLHVEDQRVKFSLDVTASVVRAGLLDDQFWRIDCKLLVPLNDQQILQLKEHVSSCFAG